MFFFKIDIQKNDLNTAKDILCQMIGCFIGLHNFIFLKNSIKVIYFPNIPIDLLTSGATFTSNKKKCFIENKSKTRPF